MFSTLPGTLPPRVPSFGSLLAAVIALTVSCAPPGETMNEEKVRAMAAAYTAAWSSQVASRVASHYAESGSLRINEGETSVGRAAITESAQAFMTAFPDMVVSMDSLHVDGTHARYHWTLTGTNNGPGGTGKRVRFSGHEEWTLTDDGRIEQSLGHFDQAEYERQLKGGATPGT